MTKKLFFDHAIVTDTALVTGEYSPKTDAEYERLAPFAVKQAEAKADDKKKADDK